MVELLIFRSLKMGIFLYWKEMYIHVTSCNGDTIIVTFSFRRGYSVVLVSSCMLHVVPGGLSGEMRHVLTRLPPAFG